MFLIQEGILVGGKAPDLAKGTFQFSFSEVSKNIWPKLKNFIILFSLFHFFSLLLFLGGVLGGKVAPSSMGFFLIFVF